MGNSLFESLELLKQNFDLQLKFNDLTTYKFNELIDGFNELEKKVKDLEYQVNFLIDKVSKNENYKNGVYARK